MTVPHTVHMAMDGEALAGPAPSRPHRRGLGDPVLNRAIFILYAALAISLLLFGPRPPVARVVSPAASRSVPPWL